MGRSTSVAQFTGKIDRAAKAMADTRRPLEAVGLAGKAAFVAAAGGAIGTTPSGKRKPVGARYDLGKKQQGTAQVVVTYTGAAHLLNNPTDRHFIGPKGFGSLAALRRLGAGVGAVTSFGGSARGIFAQAGAGRELHTRGGQLVSRKRKGSRALKIGADYRAYAFHPGTKGKGFAQKAKVVVAEAAPRVYQRAGITGPLKEVFR